MMYQEEYKVNYNYTTKRLVVKEWHAFNPQELGHPSLESIVQKLLVPEVTRTFPVMWQGNYDTTRARFWIDEINSDSKGLLAVEKNTNMPIGIVTFFREGDRRSGTNLRLGYLLSKAMWDNGYGTELVQGFIDLCKERNISTVLAGVAPDNIASIRVLEKNDFSTQNTDANGSSLLYVHHLAGKTITESA